MNNQLLFQCYRTNTEKYLSDYYTQKSLYEPQKRLFDSMRYSLEAGGKRLRPIFTCEFSRILSGEWKQALPLACAVEMVHTYSLIHDDLPSMDNDDYRRGKLTNHKVFGDAVAILAGDALLTDSFAIISSAEELTEHQRMQAVFELSRAAGSCGMVGGQVLDILSEERACTENEILAIQTRKTGCLIEAACILGAIAGAAEAEQMHRVRRYAQQIGLAFQIRDDVLDVIGNAAELGKATGVDEKKNTFVRLYGVEKCEELVCNATEAAISCLDGFNDTDQLINLSRQLTGRRQ